MKTPPLATVVIPAYNAQTFVQRTLVSVLAQTYHNLEVIFVDDGSTDNTRQIAEAAAGKDDRLRIVSVPNGGVANARNIGIEEARGEFVAFLDADDLWHPTKLERQVSTLVDNSSGQGAAAVYAFSRKIDSDDRLCEDMKAIPLYGYAFARHLFAKPIGNGSTVLIYREVAHAVEGYDAAWVAQGIGGCEDLDFELKVVSRYPITTVEQYLVGYRMYNGNMSSNKLPMARGAVATIDKHIRLHPELPNWVAQKARGAVLQYSLGNLAAAKLWSLFGIDLARLIRADTRRGAEYIVNFPLRRFHRRASVRTAQTRAKLPLFYDISPFEGVQKALQSFNRRHLQTLEKLKAVDAVLEADFFGKGPF